MTGIPSELPLIGISLDEDLRLTVGTAAARLTPRAGLELAEQLTRQSFRRMLIEEAAADLLHSQSR